MKKDIWGGFGRMNKLRNGESLRELQEQRPKVRKGPS